MTIDIWTLLTRIGLIGGTIAMFSTAFWFMEARHASQLDTIEAELEAKDDTIDTRAGTAHYYRALADERELTQSEKSRLRHVESQLEQDYKDVERLQQRRDKLKDSGH